MVVSKPRIFEFGAQLEDSQKFQQYLESIVRTRFGPEVRVEQASEKADKEGTDYWVYVGNRDHPYSFDLKVRYKDWSIDSNRPADDLALETWSAIGQKIGWTRDNQKKTDFVVWYWVPTKRYYILPFPVLCRIFCRFWQTWSKEYRTAIQDSGGWKSECVFVPRAVLDKTVKMWGAGKLKD